MANLSQGCNSDLNPNANRFALLFSMQGTSSLAHYDTLETKLLITNLLAGNMGVSVAQEKGC